jgi:hypothetical protein
MLKEFDQEIWIADGPSVAVAGFNYPTRMAVIRLSNGGIVTDPAHGQPAGRRGWRRLSTAHCCSQFAPSSVSSGMEARLPRCPGVRAAEIAKETRGPGADIGIIEPARWIDLTRAP